MSRIRYKEKRERKNGILEKKRGPDKERGPSHSREVEDLETLLSIWKHSSGASKNVDRRLASMSLLGSLPSYDSKNFSTARQVKKSTAAKAMPPSRQVEESYPLPTHLLRFVKEEAVVFLVPPLTTFVGGRTHDSWTRLLQPSTCLRTTQHRLPSKVPPHDETKIKQNRYIDIFYKGGVHFDFFFPLFLTHDWAQSSQRRRRTYCSASSCTSRRDWYGHYCRE